MISSCMSQVEIQNGNQAANSDKHLYLQHQSGQQQLICVDIGLICFNIGLAMAVVRTPVVTSCPLKAQIALREFDNAWRLAGVEYWRESALVIAGAILDTYRSRVTLYEIFDDMVPYATLMAFEICRCHASKREFGP